MSKYNFTVVNYAKFGSFFQHFPPDHQEQIQDTIIAGHLLARKSLQAALDAADTTAYSLSTAVVMHSCLISPEKSRIQ